jgi:glucosamine--fructose-6-phosphate aminotransferase (isomerizing)
MCGIVGYIGSRSATEVLLDGLRRLEYRGYDSAGIALHHGDHLEIFRVKGKIADLERSLPTPQPTADCGIGHTRWATHGRPSEANAHPHRAGDVIVVHNGIIENHIDLRQGLQAEGREFSSETDTEIFAHLIHREFDRGAEDLAGAVRRALAHVTGSYALGVVHTDCPDSIVCARRGSPLIVGYGDHEVFLASDIPAILSYTRDMAFLEDGDLAILTRDGIQLFDATAAPVAREMHHISWDPITAERGGYSHFMLKEIHEQPRVIADTLAGRINLDHGTVLLENGLDVERLKAINRILVVACGTSHHAGMLACYQFERYLGIPARSEYASEFRYREPVVGPDVLVIAVSQSGETADTLAAVELAKEQGAPVLAVCNVISSSLARAADYVVYTHAGPEISVASTKAFSTQLVGLQLLLLHLARLRGAMGQDDMKAWLKALSHVPVVARKVLKLEKEIIRLARRLSRTEHMLYLGRGLHYPLALEGALKLKEISYIHAEAYPSGEMKHGPIALIDHQMPVLVIVHNSPIREKVIANIEEVKARDGQVIAIAMPGDEEVIALADHTIQVPSIDYNVDPILLSIPLQLLAYHVAVHRGTDVDQPRNLAKSVTVE